MAKFRSSHVRRSGRLFPGYFRVLLILGFLIILFFLAKPFVGMQMEKLFPPLEAKLENVYYLPTSQDMPVFHRNGYALAYNEKTEQPVWVAYELTIDHLNARKTPRSDYFKEDRNIPTGSSTFSDYKNSGFTKGHLVPAADRAYSKATMEETFLMSNISPQIYAFNGGIWRELEEQTRDWARLNKHLYVISGPIFKSTGTKYIGENRVAVPDWFFKVLLDANEPEMKGIGFVIPNHISTKPLSEFALCIDEVEQKTGLDFFAELLTDKLEDSLENYIQLSAWPFNEKRFETRINYWNKR